MLATKEPDGNAVDAERYEAVLRRDVRADGTFFYAVKTTGVYCRPSCGARAPLRANVSFHASADAAESAGFRACKRCRPRDGTTADRERAVAVAMCRAIDAREVAPSLEDLAREVGLSAFHAHRVFKRVMGVTPKAYATSRGAERIRASLHASSSVTEAIYDAGFASSGRFYEASRTHLGMTPSAFRAGGAAMELRVSVGACTLGCLLVASTQRGVAALLLGDDEPALRADLRARFPRATFAAGDGDALARAIAVVDARDGNDALPLDLRGTAFQLRVWEALRSIPSGHTATYSELAERIGAPRSVRAVASACAANPVAVAVPCHRVVRRTGELAGYRWGLARKRALLDRESP